MPAIDKIAAGLAAVARPVVPVKMWAELMKQPLIDSGLVTGRRIAAFLGQVSVESAGFTAIEENLNYSATALLATWPSHFDEARAETCARNPTLIANAVYCNRMGNGDAASGDGWTYRGAGLIQVTGKTNQLACAAALKLDPARISDYLRTPMGALRSALWFWNANSLNTLADSWLLTIMSRRINGGEEGLGARLAACNTVMEIVGP